MVDCQSLAKAFPIRENEFPEITPVQIVRLADGLVVQDELLTIFRQLGELLDATAEQRLCMDQALIELCSAHSIPPHDWDNINIATALARRLVSGRVSNVGSGAVQYVSERIRLHPMWADDRSDVRMKISEMVEIFESFKTNCGDEVAIYEEIHSSEDKDIFRQSTDPKYEDLGMRTATRLEHLGVWVFGYANRERSDISKMVRYLISYAFEDDPPTLTGNLLAQRLLEPATMLCGKVIGRTGDYDPELPRFIDDLI